MKPVTTQNGKIAPAWHGEALAILKGNYSRILADFCNSNKRAIWMGIFFIYIKTRGKEDRSIPHGRFMPWVSENFPDASHRTVSSWMLSAEEILEAAKVQIGNFCQFAHRGELSLIECWTAEPEKLPAPVREMRQCIDEEIENRNERRMLVLSSKQVKKGTDGELHVHRGCLPGNNNKKPKDAIDETEEENTDFLVEVSNDLFLLADPKDSTLRKNTIPKVAKFIQNCEAALARARKDLKERKS